MSNTPRAYGFSHIGHRSENQDRFRIFDSWREDESLLIVVADGMGGHNGGSLAAEAVISAADAHWAHRNRYNSMRDFLNELVEVTQEAVLQIEVGEHHDLEPHTTVVALYIQKDQALSMHIGDSRVMQYRNNTFVKRTTDHTLTELLFLRGKITEDEMATHPDQNKLSSCLGSNGHTNPDFNEWDISTACSFVICTDGFWELWPKDIIAMFIDQLNTADDLQQRVMAALHEYPRHDNTTAVILHVDNSMTENTDTAAHPPLIENHKQSYKQSHKKFSRYRPFIFTTLILLLLGLIAFLYSVQTLLKHSGQLTSVKQSDKPMSSTDTFLTESETAASPEMAPTETQAGPSQHEHPEQSIVMSSSRPPTVKLIPTAKHTPAPLKANTSMNTTDDTIREFTNLPYINAEKAATVVTTHLQNIGILGPQDQLKTESVTPFQQTARRIELKQWHNHIPVLSGAVWANVENHFITSITGRPLKNIRVNVEPTLSFQAALAKAKQSSLDTLINTNQQMLVVFRHKQVDHLGWMIEGQRDGHEETIIISAKNGDILFQQPTVSNTSAHL
ncbi:MAG: serine/threonine-protein phosphatase [Gammaproteobacteria bacterium]